MNERLNDCQQIDPNRLGGDRDAARRNQKQLEARCKQFIDAIISGVDTIPLQLRWAASSLKTIISRHFPGDPSAVYTAVGSLYFLRFICPAIVSPAHYKIISGRVAMRHSLIILIQLICHKPCTARCMCHVCNAFRSLT
jgi:hypothetical protein